MVSNEKVVNFNHECEDGEKFSGTFVIKRASIMDSTRISKMKSILLGGLPPINAGEDYQAEVIAHLQIVVKESPPWWDLENLYEFGIADGLYKEVKSFEDTFRKNSRRDIGKSEGNSEKESKG